jgi:hypothetical protein
MRTPTPRTAHLAWARAVMILSDSEAHVLPLNNTLDSPTLRL